MSWVVPWLFPLVACVAAVFALYASDPSRRTLACLAAGLMLLVAVWQGALQYRAWSTAKVVEKYAYSELETTTRNILGLVQQMSLQASESWLPGSEDEFFSDHTTQLICRYLNIDRPAPIIPDRTWLVWISQQTKEAQDEITNVLNSYAVSLDQELLSAVIDFKKSFFLTFPAIWVTLRQYDAQTGAQRPPLLCPGLEGEVQKWLVQLQALYTVLWKRTGSPPFPLVLIEDRQRTSLGTARFSDGDLQKWAAEHPYAPSGKPPG